jgi:hypothetical protein
MCFSSVGLQAWPGRPVEQQGNEMRKYLGLLAVLPFAANAALPADVTTAFTTATTDSGVVWAAMVAIALVGVGFKLGIIGLKKAPGMVK